jgi:hypothetical protein
VPGALQGFLLLKQNEEGFYANPPINIAGSIGVSGLIYGIFASCFIILAENLHLT